MRLTDLLSAIVGALSRPAQRQDRRSQAPGTTTHPGTRTDDSSREGSGRTTSQRPSGTGGSPGGSASDRDYPAPVKGITNYDLRAGRPEISYAPETDGDPDPGEVVWGWVPYEDDPSQGKDRPVLIIGHGAGALVGIQLTSKDRAADGRAGDADGRIWMDVGTGAWDRKQRPSEVRLDRLLRVEGSAVRREGGALPRDRFDAVVIALGELHHW